MVDKTAKGGGKKSKKSTATAASSLSFEWESARETVMRALCFALAVDPTRVWRQSVPDRMFMGLFLRLACKVLELPGFPSARQIALELIGGTFLMAPGMESEISAAVFQLVCGCGHQPTLAAFAKLCHELVEKHSDARLGAELVRDIGRMEMRESSRYAVIVCVFLVVDGVWDS